MTDEERAKRLDIARQAFEEIAGDEGITSEGILACGLATAFEVLASLVRSRTTPREQPAQDVSDELLSRCLWMAQFYGHKEYTDQIIEIQRARAAQGEGGMNSWPGGVRKAMTQDQHARWNALNYPGTRQLCSECESETGRCEEDAIYVGDRGPLCDECEGGRDV